MFVASLSIDSLHLKYFKVMCS